MNKITELSYTKDFGLHFDKYDSVKIMTGGRDRNGKENELCKGIIVSAEDVLYYMDIHKGMQNLYSIGRMRKKDIDFLKPYIDSLRRSDYVRFLDVKIVTSGGKIRQFRNQWVKIVPNCRVVIFEKKK